MLSANNKLNLTHPVSYNYKKSIDLSNPTNNQEIAENKIKSFSIIEVFPKLADKLPILPTINLKSPAIKIKKLLTLNLSIINQSLQYRLLTLCNMKHRVVQL